MGRKTNWHYIEYLRVISALAVWNVLYAVIYTVMDRGIPALTAPDCAAEEDPGGQESHFLREYDS